MWWGQIGAGKGEPSAANGGGQGSVWTCLLLFFLMSYDVLELLAGMREE